MTTSARFKLGMVPLPTKPPSSSSSSSSSPSSSSSSSSNNNNNITTLISLDDNHNEQLQTTLQSDNNDGDNDDDESIVSLILEENENENDDEDATATNSINNNSVVNINYHWTSQNLGLAIPALIGMLADPILSLIDTVYVGRGLGPLDLAALGACTSIFHLAFNAFRASTTATTSLVATALAHHRDEAQQVTRISLQFGTVLGILVLLGFWMGGTHALAGMGVHATSPLFPSACDYLFARCWAGPAVLMIVVSEGVFRGYGDTRIPLLASAVAAVVNLVFDPICMFQWGWGIRGAAAATALSQVGAAMVYAIFLRKRNMLPPSKRQMQQQQQQQQQQQSVRVRKLPKLSLSFLSTIPKRLKIGRLGSKAKKEDQQPLSLVSATELNVVNSATSTAATTTTTTRAVTTALVTTDNTSASSSSSLTTTTTTLPTSDVQATDSSNNYSEETGLSTSFTAAATAEQEPMLPPPPPTTTTTTTSSSLSLSSPPRPLSSGKIVREILAANLAMFAKQGSLLLAWTYATARATRLGHAHVAAHQVALSFWMIFALILDGAAVSAQVLMGRAHAQQDAPQVQSLIRYMTTFATVQGVMSTIAILMAGTSVPFLFTPDLAIRSHLVHLMPHLAFQQILVSLTLVMESLVIGANEFNLLAIGTAISTMFAMRELHNATTVVGIWSKGIVMLFAGRLLTALIGTARIYATLPPPPPSTMRRRREQQQQQQEQQQQQKRDDKDDDEDEAISNAGTAFSP